MKDSKLINGKWVELTVGYQWTKAYGRWFQVPTEAVYIAADCDCYAQDGKGLRVWTYEKRPVHELFHSEWIWFTATADLLIPTPPYPLRLKNTKLKSGNSLRLIVHNGSAQKC